MTMWRKVITPVLVLLMALCLTACGDSAADNDVDDPNDVEVWQSWDILTSADLDADCTDWQGDDGSQLRIDHGTGTYLLRTWYGRAGLGDLFEDEGGIGIISQNPEGYDAYCYLVREGGGFTVRHRNGGEGAVSGEINMVHYEPAQAEIDGYDAAMLDGVWQNALGYTISIDTEKMRFVCCDGDTLGSWPLYDRDMGAGIFMGGAELLLPVVSADGNALVLFGEENTPRQTGTRDTGVFYRGGNVESYADPANACFEEADGRIWYYDGARYFAVPAGYTLAEDGRAYDEGGSPFAPEWPAPEERFDPVAAWGAGWDVNNMGSN